MKHVYRYLDGVLVPCEWDTRTASIPVYDDEEARAIILGPCFPPQINTGLHRLDLKAEQKRSGVPAWWAPNLSRRQRCITWARTPRAERMRLAPVEPPTLRFEHFVAHRVMEGFTGPAPGCPPWEKRLQILWEATLYLPAAEKLTAQHEHDVRMMVRYGARPITKADVRAAIVEEWLASDAEVAAFVARVNGLYRGYVIEGVRASAVDMFAREMQGRLASMGYGTFSWLAVGGR